MAEGPRGHALRRGRVSEDGCAYIITTVMRDRRPIFNNLHKARVLVGTLRNAQVRDHAFTLAYVVMPDHLHWLMQLGDGMSLARVVRAVKAISAQRIGGSIWQKGFHDRALRREEDLADVAHYIIVNSVRAGVADSVWCYPHWDAVWLDPGQ